MAMQLSGSLVISGSIVASAGITGSFSGNATSASYADTLGGLPSSSFAPAATFNTVSSSYATTSGSLSTRVTNLESTSSTLTSASASFATTSGSIAGRVTLIEGQYATTGSNTFTGPQYVNQASNAIGFASTASLYTDGGLRVTKDSFVSGTAYFNNVVVYGTSSIQYITSSQVNFGTNIITVNTDTPAVRFGGLSVFDSGSTQLTGSILWDSQNNHWIYSNPSGSSYNSAMLMNGPRNTGSLGDEQGTTNNALMKGQGGDHITSSQMIDDGTTVRIPGNLQVTGSISGSSAVFSGTVIASNGTLVGGTGTTNYLPKFTGASTIGNSSLQDDGSTVTITSLTKNVGEFRIYPSSGTAILRFGSGSTEKGKLSVDTSANMIFETGGTERMRLDASGNLGLGVTPSAWESGYTVVQQNAKYFNAADGSANYQGINAYYNSGWKYIASGTAQYLQQFNGGFTFFNAASGTAGAAITWTNAMNLLPNGNLGLGVISPNQKFEVQATANIWATRFVGANVTGQSYGFYCDAGTNTSDTCVLLRSNGGNTEYMWIRGDGLTYMRGNVLIGTTTDAGYKLDVNGTGRFSGSGANAGVALTVSGANGSDGTIAKFSRGGAEKNFYISSTNNQFINLATEGDIRLRTGCTVDQPYATGINALILASTGEATFSSSISATSGLFSSTLQSNAVLTIGNQTVAGNYILQITPSTTAPVQLQGILAGTGTSQIVLQPSGDNVGIGKTGTIVGLDVYFSNTDCINSRTAAAAGNSRSLYTGYYGASATTNGSLSFNVTSNGNVTNTNNSYGAISDIKLKENIVDATPKLNDLLKVKVKNFNFIGSEEKQIGVIAQELEQVFPSMVDISSDRDSEGNDLDTTTKSVKYSVFVPMLIKAIQELKAELDQAKAEIEILKNK